MTTIGQYSVNQTTAGSHNLAWDLDKTPQEAFELHPQDIATRRGFQSDQAIPGLQIPGQGRNDHISPIRHQSIRRHPQRIDPALELADNVLLIATVISEENNLLRSPLSVVRYIKEVSLMPRSALEVLD